MSSHQPLTRQRILDATWRLMEERQGQGVRVEDVAQAAHVSRQAVYLHFTSRAGLLSAALDYIAEALGFSERLAPVFGKSGGEGMDALVDFWGAFMADSYGIARAFMAARDTDSDAAAAWSAKLDVLYEGCKSIVMCSVRDGVLSPDWTPDAAADFLWTLLSYENWAYLTRDRGWTQAEYIERTKRVLRRTLIAADALS